ncbi:hypothetical protein ACXYRP_02540 [Mycoplasma sp. 5912]
MKNFIKKWVFLFSALTPLIVASCGNTANNKEYFIKNFKDFDWYIEYNKKQNSIKNIGENYFSYMWENNKENAGEFHSLFRDKYVFIKSVDELNKLFLDKFNLNYVKKYYQTFKDKVDFDINTLTTEKLKQMNKEEFQKIYLNNEDIDEFFKTKNLLMNEAGKNNLATSQYNLVPDYKKDDATNLKFLFINLEQLGANFDDKKSTYEVHITMNVKYIDKSRTITVIKNPSNHQIKDLYQYFYETISLKTSDI